jgi:hypothetical protein
MQDYIAAGLGVEMHILDRVLRIFEEYANRRLALPGNPRPTLKNRGWGTRRKRYPLRIDRRDDSFPVEAEGEKEAFGSRGRNLL